MEVTLPFQNTNGKLIYSTIEAQSCGVPGLCIHKACGPDGPIPRYYGNRYYWCITHVSSGVSIIESLLLKNDALSLAKQLSALDWTVTPKEIKANPEYGKLVRKIKATYFDLSF